MAKFALYGSINNDYGEVLGGMECGSVRGLSASSCLGMAD